MRNVLSSTSVWQHTIAAIILQNIDLQIKNFYDPFKDDQCKWLSVICH